MTTPDYDFADCPATLLPAVLALVANATADPPVASVLAGPPGTGKTMLARRVVGAMPRLDGQEGAEKRAELRALYRVNGMTPPLDPPFRAPHHTVSAQALSGHARVGEIELARYGVLFLDELEEFSVASLQSVRYRMETMGQPPALIATTRPCPCGWRGTTIRECACTPEAVERWTSRVAKALNALGMRTAPIAITVLSLDDLKTGPRCPSTAEILNALKENTK